MFLVGAETVYGEAGRGGKVYEVFEPESSPWQRKQSPVRSLKMGREGQPEVLPLPLMVNGAGLI